MFLATTKTWATTLAFGVAVTAASLAAPAAKACPTIDIDDILGGTPIDCAVGDKVFTFSPAGGFDASLAGGTIEISSSGPNYELLFSGFTNPITNATIFFSYDAEVFTGTDEIVGLAADIGSLTTGSLPTTAANLTYSLTVPQTASVLDFTHTVTQTPGPLPILGAGAAFAFSRKLRSRISKAA